MKCSDFHSYGYHLVKILPLFCCRIAFSNKRNSRVCANSFHFFSCLSFCKPQWPCLEMRWLNRDMTEIYKTRSSMVIMNEECLFSVSHNTLVLFKEHQMELPGNRFKVNKWNTFHYMLQSCLRKLLSDRKKNTRRTHIIQFSHGKLVISCNIKAKSCSRIILPM